MVSSINVMSETSRIAPAMSASAETVTEVVETSACPLRKGNTRIYYVPKDQVEQVVDGLLQGSVDTTGTVSPSGTASGEDYILVWLPDCVGFCGYIQVPSGRQTVVAGESVSFKVIKSFKAVKSKAIVELRGLAFNPATFTTGFGKLVADMNDCKRGAKYPYDPDSVLTALTELWCKADASNRFTRPHMPQPAHPAGSALSKSPQQSFKKRKRSQETKQLNRDLLLRELTATGMSGERAVQILDNKSAGWGVAVLTGNDDQLNLTIQVYRPGHSAPVITAPFETVYKEVAQLWKVEFDTPKPKAIAKPTRFTRQQERAAAALEQRLQTEGLNETQKQQMRDMIAEALRPLADTQEQHAVKIDKVEHGQSAITKSLESHADTMQQIMPALQQMAAGWAQHQYALPAPMYAAPGMQMMPAQPQVQQQQQQHLYHHQQPQQPQQQVTQLPGSHSGQSHAHPQTSDAMQSRAVNSNAASP